MIRQLKEILKNLTRGESETEAEQRRKLVEAKQSFPQYLMKPEKCTGHSFVLEKDGRTVWTETKVTDDTRCANCGIFYSTWIYYAEESNRTYNRATSDEMGQAINFIAQYNDEKNSNDKLTRDAFYDLLESLRDRRQKYVKSKRIRSSDRGAAKRAPTRDSDS